MFTLKQLSEMDHAERCSKTSMRPDYIPKNKFVENTANGLTKSVIRFLQLHCCQAERISSMGRTIDKTKIVTDALGFSRKIGSVEYIKGTSTNGTADISSVIPVGPQRLGLSVKIEIKMKDKQSEAQKKYEKTVTASGGRYWLVHNFDEFYQLYTQLIAEFE